MTPSFRSTLVLGGARSGKSAFAEQLAAQSGLEPLYVATAEPGDAEMAARIAEHRRRRGTGWTTIEAPLELAATLEREASPGRALVVDCLTLWLSNHFFAAGDIEAETGRLCAAIADLAGPAVFVANEIGLGLVPETRLARDFRDAHGRLNQAVAEACERVVFLAAGLPHVLKPSNQDPISL